MPRTTSARRPAKKKQLSKVITKTWDQIEWTRCIKDGETYIRGKDLCRELGIRKGRLSQILHDPRGGTVHLGGAQPISFQEPGLNVWVLEDHAKQIFESFVRRQLFRAGEIVGQRMNGVEYVGRKTALALRIDGQSKGIHERTLRKLANAGMVETASIPNTLGRGREKTGFKKADILSFLARRGQKFDGIYPDGRINLSRASKNLGLSREFLANCTKKGKCVYRDDGRLPFILQKLPLGRKGSPECTVLPNDAIALKKAIAETRRQLIPGNDWEDMEDLATRYKGHSNGSLWSVLISIRANSPEKAMRIWTEDRSEHWRRVWFYEVEEVGRRLKRLPGRGGRRSSLTGSDVGAGVSGEREVNQLNGHARMKTVSAKASTPAERQTKRRRIHREEDTHLKWRQWKNEGMSYNQIVIRHKDETKETITRSAVVMALFRLHQV
jgi:hypothetical protein